MSTAFTMLRPACHVARAAARTSPAHGPTFGVRGLASSSRTPLLGLTRSAWRRQASYAGALPRSGSTDWSRIGLTAAGVVGASYAINLALNRETREALAPVEREHLNSTFKWTGGGLAIVAGTAIALHRTGFSARLMRASPWLVMGVSLVGSIGSMMLVYNTPPGTAAHTLAWVGFNASQAAVLSPLLFLHPALLGRAALYTAGVVASLSYVGATARSDQFLYMGGALTGGLVVVALSSLAPLVLPATALGTLAVTEALSLYGGLAVFGGFTLYDTQKILAHARESQITGRPLDPAAESIGLTLDFINIFVRMVMILGGGNRKR